MRRHARTWITTLALGLTVGGCLPCVPGVRVDAPRTSACLTRADAGCTEVNRAPQTAARAAEGRTALR